MIRRRRREDAEVEPTEAAPAPAPAAPGREDGPWDVRENPGTEPGYVDLGSLRIKGREGLNIQLPQDKDGNAGAAVVVTDDSGVELRVFAASRSGGLWDEVREELKADVLRREGQVEEHDGPHGPELHVRVPATLPSGEPGVQPSRIVGVEGPRWLLRATFFGRPALDPTDQEHVLLQVFRDVVVVRGDEPRPVRELLRLTVPEGAVRQQPPTSAPGSDERQA